MKLVDKVTIGADPEVFLGHEGEVISAVGLIGGTKNNPKKFDEDGFFMLEDNIMIEFNIPPSDKKKSFVDNINFAKDYILNYVKLINKDYYLDHRASAIIDEKYLNSKGAKEFGCEPDFNVYEKKINDSPSGTSNLRSCGGHIHIGYENPSQEVSEYIVYAMDIFLGLDSLLLDNDRMRRSLYGKAGCFRFKDYGVEYRTLSNFWLNNEIVTEWVWDRTQQAISLVNLGIMDEVIDKYSESVKQCIDDGNVKKGMSLFEEIKLFIEQNKKVTA